MGNRNGVFVKFAIMMCIKLNVTVKTVQV